MSKQIIVLRTLRPGSSGMAQIESNRAIVNTQGIARGNAYIILRDGRSYSAPLRAGMNGRTAEIDFRNGIVNAVAVADNRDLLLYGSPGAHMMNIEDISRKIWGGRHNTGAGNEGHFNPPERSDVIHLPPTPEIQAPANEGRANEGRVNEGRMDGWQEMNREEIRRETMNFGSDAIPTASSAFEAADAATNTAATETNPEDQAPGINTPEVNPSVETPTIDLPHIDNEISNDPESGDKRYEDGRMNPIPRKRVNEVEIPKNGQMHNMNYSDTVYEGEFLPKPDEIYMQDGSEIKASTEAPFMPEAVEVYKLGESQSEDVPVFAVQETAQEQEELSTAAENEIDEQKTLCETSEDHKSDGRRDDERRERFLTLTDDMDPDESEREGDDTMRWHPNAGFFNNNNNNFSNNNSNNNNFNSKQGFQNGANSFQGQEQCRQQYPFYDDYANNRDTAPFQPPSNAAAPGMNDPRFNNFNSNPIHDPMNRLADMNFPQCGPQLDFFNQGFNDIQQPFVPFVQQGNSGGNMIPAPNANQMQQMPPSNGTVEMQEAAPETAEKESADEECCSGQIGNGFAAFSVAMRGDNNYDSELHGENSQHHDPQHHGPQHHGSQHHGSQHHDPHHNNDHFHGNEATGIFRNAFPREFPGIDWRVFSLPNGEHFLSAELPGRRLRALPYPPAAFPPAGIPRHGRYIYAQNGNGYWVF